MNDTTAKSTGTSGATSRGDVLRRAALVLISLDDEQAAQLLAKMSPREVEAITGAIENLHEVDPAEQADALREFYRGMGMEPPSAKSSARPENQSRAFAEEDLLGWSAEQIRMSFDPAQADDWALALADCERSQVRRVLKALTLHDRRVFNEADRRRGPWRLHEPHEARERIRRRFASK